MKAAIYKIMNRLNNHIYVGSSVSLKKRWWDHRNSLRKGSHHSIPLQRAWNKYGESSFEFLIIEFVDREKLVLQEQHYLDTLNPEYNVCKIAYSKHGTRQSDETKAKISKAMSGEKHPLYGKHRSEETKEKIRNSSKGQIPWNKSVKTRVSYNG